MTSMRISASRAIVLFRRPLFALACFAALALLCAGATSQAQDKKEPDKKVQDKKDQDKKDADKKAQDKKDQDKKDTDKKAQDKKDTKKEPKKGSQTAKYETPKIEPIDTRIYPKAEPVLEIEGHTDWINRVV